MDIQLPFLGDFLNTSGCKRCKKLLNAHVLKMSTQFLFSYNCRTRSIIFTLADFKKFPFLVDRFWPVWLILLWC